MEANYPYAIKNQRGASKKPLVRGFGCDELVLYGIRDTIAKSSTSRWTTLITGSQHVIIRMSLAKQPDPQQLQTAPGIGLKFLRDGVASGNMVAMFSVDGQQSWNFFKNNFTNHIPALTSPSLLPLGIKFATATRNVQQVGLSDMAR